MIDMLRKTACAVAGITLACAAGYSLSLIAEPRASADLDLRWLHNAGKQDRLPINPVSRTDSSVVSFDLPSQATSIVIRTHVTMESAIRTPKPKSVRTVPVHPVRDAPKEEVKKDRLPVGCEPAFSPVTTPALAHIGVRCDS
jgi:hypothetical protein